MKGKWDSWSRHLKIERLKLGILGILSLCPQSPVLIPSTHEFSLHYLVLAHSICTTGKPDLFVPSKITKINSRFNYCRARGAQRDYHLKSEVNGMVLHPNQADIICACHDGYIRVIDLVANKILNYVIVLFPCFALLSLFPSSAYSSFLNIILLQFTWKTSPRNSNILFLFSGQIMTLTFMSALSQSAPTVSGSRSRSIRTSLQVFFHSFFTVSGEAFVIEWKLIQWRTMTSRELTQRACFK